MNGSFYFEEGEEGLRTINLDIYPPEEVEVQEAYIIRLNIVKGETELDPKAASITLIVNHIIFIWFLTTSVALSFSTISTVIAGGCLTM